MRFTPAPLPGAYVIEIEERSDDRGFFARGFCQQEFEEHGLSGRIAQCNVSWNEARGTLRSLHYQLPPHAEVKLIRCTRGAIYDVIVDLRRESPTYRRWFAAELTAQNHRMMYVPEGFAHGYESLEPDTEAFYIASEFYSPTHERGVRWNDPAFKIEWPIPEPILSAKDRSHPDFLPVAEPIYDTQVPLTAVILSPRDNPQLGLHL